MVVKGMTEKAASGRDHVLEFLLTSHPLDCPVCDKGGECPLQNLTMEFGPGESRFLYEDKKHLAKQVPLGELIYLDRERCIQCGRCVRFQSDIAGDPVIGFFNRGRSLEIITCSEPGFDSYFSGNTTDICPVGALTTEDFRFGARPWELGSAASICSHCPVGCNLTMNIRREASSNGDWVIKRVMPRQNEGVNEIWICDKGRFGHHYAAKRSQDGEGLERLSQPLIRKNSESDHAGELVPASWDEALEVISERFSKAGKELITLAGGRLSNEDLFNLQQMTGSLGGETLLYTHMAGGEFTTQAGLPPESNLSDLSQGDVILVAACDLEEEAPIWWLRIKAAVERGAQVISLNSRSTRLDSIAAYQLRYPFGTETSAVLAMLNVLSDKKLRLPDAIHPLEEQPELEAAAQAFSDARNGIILYGSDGIGIVESQALAQACANLLDATGHVGRANNGLLGVWPGVNIQGAWELGIKSDPNLRTTLQNAGALYIAAADPAGDDPAYLDQTGFGGKAFVVVQDLFLTQTARLADVVLPAQSWVERDGTFTSGERRVQRFYRVLPDISKPIPRTESPGTNKAPLLAAGERILEGPLADFSIPALISQRMGLDVSLNVFNPAGVFDQISAAVPVFSGLSYTRLSEVTEQWPIVGRDDLFYGGTGYENAQGLGVTLPLGEYQGEGSPQLAGTTVEFVRMPKLGQIAFPINRLYDHGRTLLPSKLLAQRINQPYIHINPHDAARLQVEEGDMVQLSIASQDSHAEDPSPQAQTVVVMARLDPELPERVVLVPRSFGIPVDRPTQVDLRQAE
jgi:NADH-quinone oxidoreductase subunit G